MMVWSMGFETGFEVHYGLEALDGDRKKIEYVDQTRDLSGVGGLFKAGDMRGGRAMKSDYVPTKVVWSGPKRLGLPDTLFGLEVYFVNEKFREVIERLEPGVHQFIPLDLLWKDRSLAQEMYFFNVCNRLDTLDHDISTAEISSGGVLQPETGTWIFNIGQIGNHHIWHDKHIFRGLYVSDQLRDALIAAGVTGLAFEQRPCTGEA